MAEAGSQEAGAQGSGHGILLLVGAVAVFSIQDIIVREMSSSYPVLEFVFFRTAFSIPPILLIVVLQGGFATMRAKRPVLLLVRGFLLLLAYTTYYLAVASLPLATAVALFFCAPLLVTAMAALLLRESVGLRRWGAIVVGFGGVLLIAQPESGFVDPGVFIAVVGAAIYSVSVIMTRKLGATETGNAMLIHQAAVYLVMSGLAGLFMQDLAVENDAHAAARFLMSGWVMPEWGHLGLMALCGVIAAAGFYGLTQAYRLAPPSVVAPFEYTGITWGILWGYVFWSEVPDLMAISGMMVIVAAGIYIIHRERVRGRRMVAGRQLRPRS
ncbi:MAG: DMT family transporter [Rhodospirillaceae bacterium]|jgi:drug/metabolite transporter (DMT)-like permease|nr:DMT family transporter [Rhodospirillaceae bacterium]MBT6511593.1 DMT family transporter [Rhodospirillaceae bacterium]MBT7613160.1 DMT family transporter [Rhodospirillaceae bacterium]MBT7649322.1 DMT family transporter [Rhodospirillaceae bacterium]